MSAWFQVGRPALMGALEAVCQQMDRDMLKYVEENQVQNDQMASTAGVPGGGSDSKAKDEQHDRIRPNRSAELPNPDSTCANTDSKTSSPLTTVSAIEGSEDLASEYKKLCARFRALDENFKKAKDALEKRRDERDHWKARAEGLERKIEAAEERLGIDILNRRSRPSSRPSEPKTHPQPSKPSLLTPFTTPVDELPAVQESHAQSSVPPVSGRQQEDGQVSTQSTESETDRKQEYELPPLPGDDSALAHIKQEPSSDAPEFVAERAVKRRRVDQDVDDIPPYRIKSEETQMSSPSVALHPNSTQESVDLGEVSRVIPTPRKSRTSNTNLTSEPLSVMAPGQLYVQARPPLLPLDLNKAVSRKKDLGRGIADLAEDGALYAETPVNENKVAHTHNSSKVEALLNTKAPTEDTTPLTRPLHRHQDPLRTPRNDLSLPKARELPFGRVGFSTGKRATASSKAPPRQSLQSPLASAEQPRKQGPRPSLLRNKPVSRLGLEDFKINPQANEGYGFAFSEVIRDKNARACLPGCKDQHCCGDHFRKLALSQRPDPPLTPAQRQEEQKLLEDYMCEEAWRIGSMDPQERAAIWLEAKTQQLADKYGKHRHRFSRMRSPPGFWNADFPSTQELEADRTEAAKRERQTVNDRYREAMRPGGRWLFRDE